VIKTTKIEVIDYDEWSKGCIEKSRKRSIILFLSWVISFSLLFLAFYLSGRLTFEQIVFMLVIGCFFGLLFFASIFDKSVCSEKVYSKKIDDLAKKKK
jgi:hypothetical protein